MFWILFIYLFILDIILACYCEPKLPRGTEQAKHLNKNYLNCNECEGLLISMFLSPLCQLWLGPNASDGFAVFSWVRPLSDYEAWMVWRCWLGIAEHIVYTLIAFYFGQPKAFRHISLTCNCILLTDTVSSQHGKVFYFTGAEYFNKSIWFTPAKSLRIR